MLRVIAIVIISFALSACRSNNDTASPAPKNTQSATSTYTQQSVSSDSGEKLPATVPSETKSKQSNQLGSGSSVSSSGEYTAQPVSPPEPANDVIYETVSVTLEWTIPVQRENGDLLGASDLDGYIIEYSSQSGTPEKQYVEGGQASSYSLSLPPGTYQFRVIAVDVNGLTSTPSDWVSANLKA